jgi:D-alanyl-D-alanine carboxypeptidase/D-alanyl-D-alanine-endopeptidase (penicillin-binding protein 4)
MNKVTLLLALVLSLPALGGTVHGRKTTTRLAHTPTKVAKAAAKSTARRPVAKAVAKPARKSVAKATSKKATGKAAAKPARKPWVKATAKSAAKASGRSTASCSRKPAVPAHPPANEVPKPAADDPDRERWEGLQEALDAVVHGKVLGRLRVGIKVEDLGSGRALYGWRSQVLMDPASNQKILATTTALLRLGNTFRYRTEVTGPHPDASGTVLGDIVLRGSGDPSLRSRDIDALAEELASQGVTRVTGAVLGDTRRIGADESGPSWRSPLRVGATSIEIHVRPGDKAGRRPIVSLKPASDAFVVRNQAQTRSRGRTKLSVEITRAGSRFQIVVGGKISIARGEAVIHRAPPSQSLFAAVLLRHAIAQAGIVVQGPAGIYSGEARERALVRGVLDGSMLALGQQGSDVAVPLASREPTEPSDLLALHESDPLPILLRRVNKKSDNEWAERVLETVGAEVMGGVPTTAKGVRVLRETLSELGLPSSAYLPANGSGLGHHNRVTAAGMVELFRRLYFDPRVGPELMQSLSIGGVDGTTRNRFRGTSAAHRVRAKTGTLNGVSCLSGFVGNASNVLAFSILVEGHRKRQVAAVRSSQVSAVNAMMHFVDRASAAPVEEEEGATGNDFENGDELDESDVTPGEEGAASEDTH